MERPLEVEKLEILGQGQGAPVLLVTKFFAQAFVMPPIPVRFLSLHCQVGQPTALLHCQAGLLAAMLHYWAGLGRN